jgi:hypothetical protein
MSIPTPSKHELTNICIGSAALPQVGSTNVWSMRGRVIHKFLSDVPKMGRDAALAQAPHAFRFDCEVIDLSVLPACEPDSYASEVTIAYDLVTGAVREVGRGLTREEMAAAVKPNEFYGTPDVIGLTADAVVLPDYKTGWFQYEASKEIQQLRDYAFLAAKLYGKTKAISGITRIREDGTSYRDECQFDAFDLATIEGEILEMAEKVRAERERVAAGGLARTVEGDHCNRCPALPYCPSKMTLVRQFAAAPEAIEAGLAEATEEQLAAAYERASAVEKVVERVKEAIRARARQSPIPMGGGYVLGKTPQEELILGAAIGALGSLHGAEVAKAATESEPKISKASIERALRKYVLKPGLKLSHLMDATMEEIRKIGGTKDAGVVKKHKPKDPRELPAGQGAP